MKKNIKNIGENKMKKLFISGMILFLCLFLVSCGGVTIPEFYPDDGGMGSYDPQFISLLNKLYNPIKLDVWLSENTQFKVHDGAVTPYEFYLKKEGDCGDYACFNCYVLHYNGYVVYWVYIAFKYEPGEPQGHAITVFEHKATDQYWGFPYLAKYGYMNVSKFWITGIEDLDSIKDCVDDFMERDGREFIYDYYEVHPWNYFYYKATELQEYRE